MRARTGDSPQSVDSLEALQVTLSDLLIDQPGKDTLQSEQQIPAAVLVPIYSVEGALGVVLTKRRSDLRRHAGEISFPGGRHDQTDPDMQHTALREAEEEIGLPRSEVSLVGVLEPVSTFVTGYVIHPFVGAIAAGTSWKLSPREVDAVLELPLEDLRQSRTKTTIERRGISFQTDAYILEEHVIWGATARILENLLRRLEPKLDRSRT